MYDKAKDDWRFRQTGVMVDVPEAYGSIFVGRTKEGFSTSKMMVGYQGWTNERAAINDAFLPILADGIKWMGYMPSGKFVYRLGFFKDTRTQDESFNKNDNQSVARGVWLPFAGTDKGVLHLALQFRHGAVERRVPAVPLQARVVSGAGVRDRHRQVRRRPLQHVRRRDLLPARAL